MLLEDIQDCNCENILKNLKAFICGIVSENIKIRSFYVSSISLRNFQTIQVDFVIKNELLLNVTIENNVLLFEFCCLKNNDTLHQLCKIDYFNLFSFYECISSTNEIIYTDVLIALKEDIYEHYNNSLNKMKEVKNA